MREYKEVKVTQRNKQNDTQKIKDTKVRRGTEHDETGKFLPSPSYRRPDAGGLMAVHGPH